MDGMEHNFCLKIILMISNKTQAARSFDFEIKGMISDPLLQMQNLTMVISW